MKIKHFYEPNFETLVLKVT